MLLRMMLVASISNVQANIGKINSKIDASLLYTIIASHLIAGQNMHDPMIETLFIDGISPHINNNLTVKIFY